MIIRFAETWTDRIRLTAIQNGGAFRQSEGAFASSTHDENWICAWDRREPKRDTALPACAPTLPQTLFSSRRGAFPLYARPVPAIRNDATRLTGWKPVSPSALEHADDSDTLDEEFR